MKKVVSFLLTLVMIFAMSVSFVGVVSATTEFSDKNATDDGEAFHNHLLVAHPQGDASWDIEFEEPTCTQDGYTKWTCTACGQVYYNDFIQSNGHNWKLWHIEDCPSIYSDDGQMRRYCVDCDELEIAEIGRIPLTDIPAGSYFEEPVYWAYYNNITTGKTATTFQPNANVTRAQFVTFLWRSAGSPEPKATQNPFTDIDPTKSYYRAVLWAVEEGITTGKTATTFLPDDSVTRAQAVTFLYRYSDIKGSSIVNPFKDIPAGKYYTEPVLWAYQYGITQGRTATEFRPNEPCTRAQTITFLFRLIDDLGFVWYD